MSYAKVIAGLGIALVALLALGASITLAAQWRVAMKLHLAVGLHKRGECMEWDGG